jgi:hypothetical protein
MAFTRFFLVISCLALIHGGVSAADITTMRTFSITHKPGQGLTRGEELVFCDYNATQVNFKTVN